MAGEPNGRPRKRLAGRAVVRSPRLGLTAISLGFLMITLDATIVNVALGPIGADLGGAVSTAQWIVNGYSWHSSFTRVAS